ncbi:family 18 glycosyl hydrolase [Colletotrichum acutatum]|uniref:chitinase n=1 Tax=Glomerella acutata TaxID=27357 RepID=A0AAD8UMF7_GLOAC|nr:family 18 glycosyl hydrolase [Colletotrichum acutatum]KAK1725512.1 family 18 glycosyl hydrolase [Colletotrichum acutatum]
MRLLFTALGGLLIPLQYAAMAFAQETAGKAASDLKCVMYLTGHSQHPNVPSRELVSHITHVELAFMNSDTFNKDVAEWPLFTTVDKVRTQFMPGTKVMVAIGGWSDTKGFDTAARTPESRRKWAQNVADMVLTALIWIGNTLGELQSPDYLGLRPLQGTTAETITNPQTSGNGEDYKVKNSTNEDKKWEIEAYPLLLEEVRRQLPKGKLISAATPGLERDMIAFTKETVPRIVRSLDFVNVMTYDMMNRRDNVTKHHTGMELSRIAVDNYMARGVPAHKINLGFAFYTKWFKTTDCPEGKEVGCPTPLMEDPVTGGDLGQTGGFSWNDGVQEDVKASFERAQKEGKYDKEGGGYYYLDRAEKRFWTYDTPDAILRKFPALVDDKRLGGVFAWGLGEDGPEYNNLKAVNKGLAERRGSFPWGPGPHEADEL